MRQYQGEDHGEARLRRARRRHCRRSGRALGRRKIAIAPASRTTIHEPRTPESETARLFFALWPDARTQRALGALALDLRRTCGGRAVPAGNVHLTLHFLGNVERARISRLEALAAAIRNSFFELSVDRVEFWRRNHIVWAGARCCPGALQELVAQLGARLAGEGIRIDERPYVPHITLLRNARRPPAAVEVPAITWSVAGIALVESVQRERGRIYEVVREWPLTA